MAGDKDKIWMTILVVENNMIDLKTIERVFEEKDMPFVELLEVGTVKQACDAMVDLLNADRLPDLVLLDLFLPDFNGFEVLKTIKADEELASVPVVVLTSSRDEADEKRALSQGATAYVRKPEAPDDWYDMAETIKSYWHDEHLGELPFKLTNAT